MLAIHYKLMRIICYSKKKTWKLNEDRCITQRKQQLTQCSHVANHWSGHWQLVLSQSNCCAFHCCWWTKFPTICFSSHHTGNHQQGLAKKGPQSLSSGEKVAATSRRLASVWGQLRIDKDTNCKTLIVDKKLSTIIPLERREAMGFLDVCNNQLKKF